MKPLIRRVEARKLSLTRYFNGKPCKEGHIAERLVSSGQCIVCTHARSRPRLKAYLKTPHGKAVVNGRRKTNRTKLKAEVITHYGGKCACCGEAELSFLCMDHIEGGGNKHRREEGKAKELTNWLKRNNYPEGFQVLCANCNLSKHLLGVCFHKRPVTKITGLNAL